MSGLLAGLLALLAVAAPEQERAVMLPIRLAPGASREAVAAAPGLEAAFAEALARHASFHLVSRAEVTALAGQAAREQLTGCDADSCVAEVADALGARLVVLLQLDVGPGLWSFQASLVDRQQAQALRRAAVKARALDGVLASLDQVARQLASGSRISAEDPRLQERLGTDAEGMKALHAALASAAAPDVTDAWTSVVMESNGESEALALAEGAALAGAGTAVAVGAAVGGAADALALWSVLGKRGFPVGLGLTSLLLPLPFWLLGLGGLGAAGALALVDVLDLGRIPVAQDGCCRDEERVRAKEAPGWGRRAGPALAAVGSILGLTAPGILGLVMVGVLGVGLAGSALGVGLPLQDVVVGQQSPVELFPVVATAHLLAAVGMVTMPVFAAGLAGAGLLVFSDSPALTDRE